MKTSVIYNAWASYFINRLPCPLTTYSMTKEHIAPKSLFPPIITHTDANILPMPARLNNKRGNKPYTKLWEDGHLVYACDKCPTPGFCRGAGIMSVSGLYPPDIYKGPIARSVLYNAKKYPSFAKRLNDKVLNIETAYEWDFKYPISEIERRVYLESENNNFWFE